MEKDEVKKIIEEEYFFIKKSKTFKFLGGLIGTVVAILGISIYTLVTTLNSKGVNEIVSQIEDNKKKSESLVNSIQSSFKIITNLDTINLPIGSIIAYSGNSENISGSTKWKICDGSQLDREEYKELFDSIEVNWGAGNSKNTFNLPDLRGQFLRGVNMGSKNDPDAKSRTSKFIAGNEGDNVGSFQKDQYRSHKHESNASKGVGSNWRGGENKGKIQSGPAQFEASGGSETRPKNAYVYWIIKVK